MKILSAVYELLLVDKQTDWHTLPEW